PQRSTQEYKFVANPACSILKGGNWGQPVMDGLLLEGWAAIDGDGVVGAAGGVSGSTLRGRLQGLAGPHANAVGTTLALVHPGRTDRLGQNRGTP
ncbi:MAG: hypothetical protein ACK55Z_34420, partial [bacterium]